MRTIINPHSQHNKSNDRCPVLITCFVSCCPMLLHRLCSKCRPHGLELFVVCSCCRQLRCFPLNLSAQYICLKVAVRLAPLKVVSSLLFHGIGVARPAVAMALYLVQMFAALLPHFADLAVHVEGKSAFQVLSTGVWVCN